ncbi:MAG: tRNA lysidine(34) synthetase TilS [Parachlamydiales bacterium]|nr:tRNA lysidine(34) synthetase TilS [Parachlamydiales bacterium]
MGLVKDFLDLNYSYEKPLLLGFSGGSDSSVLLHLLLDIRSKKPFPLHLAHIDHGWREESHNQALDLKKLAESLNLPFHSIRLKKYDGINLEEEARKQRFIFFKKIYREYQCEALLLAHQNQDQSETVFKRLLEGSHWTNMQGIKSMSTYDGMIVWRPLLKMRKKDIEKVIEEKQLQVIRDSTNLDARFLRSRMRLSLFPYLEAQFGKNFNNNIDRLSLTIQEFNRYFDNKLSKYLKQSSKGPLGVFLDLNELEEPIEIEFVVKSFFQNNDLVLSATELSTIVYLIHSHSTNKTMTIKNRMVGIDRRHLFLFNDLPISEKNREIIYDKKVLTGLWSGELTQNTGNESVDWKKLWISDVEVKIPSNIEWMGFFPDHCDEKQREILNKWWSKHKIPAFLRQKVPILGSGNKVLHEFLTGKSLSITSSQRVFLLRINK